MANARDEAASQEAPIGQVARPDEAETASRTFNPKAPHWVGVRGVPQATDDATATAPLNTRGLGSLSARVT